MGLLPQAESEHGKSCDARPNADKDLWRTDAWTGLGPHRPGAGPSLGHGACGRARPARGPGRESGPLTALERGGGAAGCQAVVRAVAAAVPDDEVFLGQVRYRLQGWNGSRADPVGDVRRALAELVRLVGAVPVILVGHSMGGRAAACRGGDTGGGAGGAGALVSGGGRPVAHLQDKKVIALHGDRDRVTDPSESIAFVRRARAAGSRAVCCWSRAVTTPCSDGTEPGPRHGAAVADVAEAHGAARRTARPRAFGGRLRPALTGHAPNRLRDRARREERNSGAPTASRSLTLTPQRALTAPAEHHGARPDE